LLILFSEFIFIGKVKCICSPFLKLGVLLVGSKCVVFSDFGLNIKN